MSEPTVSRAVLRRAIARDLRMPFARLIGDSSTITGSPTAAKGFDSKLKQPSSYWNGHYWYIATDAGGAGAAPEGEVRRILTFLRNDQSLVPEYNFTASLGAGDTYEIHSMWSANDLHNAINEAIDEAWPAFADIGMDETHVIQEDTLEYPLSITNLSKIFKIWLERPDSSQIGTAVAGAATTITLPSSANLASVDTSWKISIYGGTGTGQVRSVVSADNGTKIVTVATWTTNPDSTSKYRLWDAAEQTRDWYKYRAVRFDNPKHHTTMYLGELLPSFYGGRFRIQYEAKPPALAADSGTTIVPREYIVPKVMSKLYYQMVGDNRYDRSRMSERAQTLEQQAEQYKRAHATNRPAGTIWSLRDEYIGPAGDIIDPLGWRD